MQRNYLIVAEKEETRSALATLLRAQGLTVSLAARATDALQVSRSSLLDTVLIVSRDKDVSAEKIRTRILAEQPDCRVIRLTSVSSARNKARVGRFGIGDYLMGERELLALLGAPHGASDGQEGDVPENKPLRSLIELVDVLVGLLELGERHFASSSHRAMQLARAVAEEMKLSQDLIIEIVIATLVRDIGKHGLDQNIFNESGSLSQEQMSQMSEHVVAGTHLLEHIEFPWKITAIIRHHHERYDGQGYPDGLKGPEIPLGARILAVVDAFAAMLSERPHRPCLSREQALGELERQAGFQFDPEIVELFMRVLQNRGVPLSAIERPKLVVADRNAEFVSFLKMRLQNEGMDVRATTNLQDALPGILESPPNLILAEVDPEENRSFEFLRAMRQDESLAHVPFAFMVPRFDLTLAVRVLNHGVDECLSKSEGLELMVARIKNILVREERRRGGPDGPKRRGIVGQLETLALPDIIQILHMGVKTACLSLSSDGSTGKIWFDAGTAGHAETGSLRGAEAIFRMLEWKSGEFIIEHGLKTEHVTIQTDTMFMLMEGMRLIDEASLLNDPAHAGGTGEGSAVPS